MKKIGLCICYDVENFGSTLQAFATIFGLKKIGCDCEIIRYRKKKNLRFYITSFFRLFNVYMLEDKRKRFVSIVSKLLHPSYKKYCAKWHRNFESFQQSHFSPLLSPENYGFKELQRNSINYKAVLSGSDQLWTPSGLPTGFYNLMFVSNDVPKISYASSFGCTSIPWFQKKRTQAYLRRIDAISVRENAGAKIVREMIGKDVPVVVDPTMLLTRDEWLEQVPDKILVEKPYIFAYLLGTNKSHRNLVVKFAKQVGLPIVTVSHCDHYNKADLGFGDFVRDDVGPEEFVNLIRHATYVCTDSFHGSVFSIIHHKQFVTFTRYAQNAVVSKNSRIESLFQNFKLEQRLYGEGLLVQIQRPIDYAFVEKKLAEMRKSSFDYLESFFSRMQGTR